MSKPKTKALKDLFEEFFENPSKVGLKELLKGHVGEEKEFDFKQEWPGSTRLSKQILGIANSGGGCIILGVSERQDKTFEPVGLPTLQDKADFRNLVKTYLPSPLLNNLSLEDFCYEESEYPKLKGKKFQVVFIVSDASHLPYVCTRDGEAIRQAAIYVRRQGLTEEAGHDDLQQLINARIATRYSTDREITLKNHLEELKLLYSQIQSSHSDLNINTIFNTFLLTSPNPNYPSEGYERFVARMIKRKKRRIEEVLDILTPNSFENPPLGS